MPYTFNGSYPSEPDDKKGWVYVSNPPPVPEGKELAWLNWEWVIRDPKPENTPGFVWKWNHGEYAWVEYEIPNYVEPEGNVTVTLNTNTEGE